jgi:CdiI immunity protein
MTSREQDERLSAFLGAYFHQDWELDARDPEGVVSQYLASSRPEEAALLAQDVVEFAASHTDDERLDRALLDELGCYYNPNADGMTPREWLGTVSKALLMSSEAR